MLRTSIIGAGMTSVGEHWGQSLRAIAAEAAHKALDDAGLSQVSALYVSNAYGSTFNSQSQMGALIADYIGMSGIEAYTIEAGDASGGAALRAAHLAVASGAVESAMVLGVEKVTDIVAGPRVAARTISLDADYEAVHGATLTTQAALLMQRYMHENGLELSAFEGFSINAHANGKANPLAMYRNAIRVGTFANAPMVSDPVNLFDTAPDGDGAAAVIIVAEPGASRSRSKAVQIAGSSVSTDRFMLQEREDPLYLRAVEQSVRQALKQAGLSLDDIDIFEVHDAYTILSAMALEAAGFAGRGKGWELAQDMQNSISLSGRIPLSTFGGMKSRGNPAGAAGVYQAVEATLQLRGEAGSNQVAGAHVAMIQNMGGLGSTVATHILRSDH